MRRILSFQHRSQLEQSLANRRLIKGSKPQEYSSWIGRLEGIAGQRDDFHAACCSLLLGLPGVHAILQESHGVQPGPDIGDLEEAPEVPVSSIKERLQTTGVKVAHPAQMSSQVSICDEIA